VTPVPPSAPPLSKDLNVVKKGEGPVLTTVDEFYKVGPGPSSSHTIGPMRITYDFYQRAAKLPADKLAGATKLQVNLFGSLSATGKGHGTERAALAGLVGQEPATVDPKFLDSLRDKPDQVFPVKLGSKSIDVSLKDVVYDATKGDFKHPNTMTVKLLAGNDVLLEQEYYSVGGGFIEWKGYEPPKKNAPKYPFRLMKETPRPRRRQQDHDRQDRAGERDVDFGQIGSRGLRLGRQGHQRDGRDGEVGAGDAGRRRAARSDQAAQQGGHRLQAAMDDKLPADRGIGVLSAFALAASEENGRGHLVITAPPAVPPA
jgi:L-serine dehydratase